MQAGQLRSRVTLQTPTSGVDALGQPLQTWVNVAVVWANVRYLNGIETIKAGAQAGTSKVSIRIRYRTGVVSSMRVVHAGVVMQITAVLPDAARNLFIDLVCEVLT